MLNTVHYLLLPSHRNNYKAKLLHNVGYLFIGAFILSFQVFTQVGTHASVLGYAANIDVNEVVRLTNVKREGAGLNDLTINPLLTQAAHDKGVHMLEHNYWAHVAPDGTQPWDFFKEVGYSYRYAGENLARDFATSSSAVDAWMASPSHRENMLSDKYNDIGVAVVEGNLNGEDTTIIVQLFGTKADTLPVVPVAAAEDNVNTLPAQDQKPATKPEIKPGQQVKTGTIINSQTPSTNTVVASPFFTTRTFYIFLLSVLFIVLVADMIVVEREGVVRFGGRSFAHLSFITVILIIIILAQSGEVL